MRRSTSPARHAPLSAALVAAAFAGCGGESATDPELPELPGWDGRFFVVETLRFQGRDRDFRLQLPSGYDHETRIPLLLAFHGSGDNGASFQAAAALERFADPAGIAVVYPSAVAGWAEACDCTPADRLGVDDLGFVAALVEEISSRWAVDPSRVAATGFSQGGFFAHRLACESDSAVRAVATMGATTRTWLPELCERSRRSRPRSVPILIGVGEDDDVVPPEGRDDLLSLAESAALWRQVNDCGEASTVTAEPADPDARPRLVRETWESCTAGAVRADLYQGVAHLWPGAGGTGGAVDTSRETVEWVRRHLE